MIKINYKLKITLPNGKVFKTICYKYFYDYCLTYSDFLQFKLWKIRKELDNKK